MSESVIITATGSAAGSRMPGLGKHLEAAMTAAVHAALADGVIDDKEILARKLKARDVAKAEFFVIAAKAAADEAAAELAAKEAAEHDERALRAKPIN